MEISSNKTKNSKDYSEINRKVYDNIAEHWNTRREFCWRPVDNFYDTIPKNGKLIDLGCGNGRHLKLAQEKGFNVTDLYGCDISEKQLEVTKTAGFDNIKQCNFTDMPYDDETFDFMICIAALHHLPDPELQLKALNEMYRIMKASGKLLLSNWFPNKNYMDKQIEKGKITIDSEQIIIVSYMKKFNRYYYMFNEDELIALCEKANFKITKKEHFKDNFYITLEKH